MKILGIKLGGSNKKADDATKAGGLGQLLHNLRKIISRYHTLAMVLLVGAILALSAFKMLGYVDPAADPDRAAENATKLKRITIDPKIVERIKQLNDSQTTTSPNFPDDRSNPFSE